jgi:hypothetical protein
VNNDNKTDSYFELLLMLSYEFTFPVEKVIMLTERHHCAKCWRDNQKLIRIFFLSGRDHKSPFSDDMTECCADRVACAAHRKKRDEKDENAAVKYVRPLPKD